MAVVKLRGWWKGWHFMDKRNTFPKCMVSMKPFIKLVIKLSEHLYSRFVFHNTYQFIEMGKLCQTLYHYVRNRFSCSWVFLFNLEFAHKISNGEFKDWFRQTRQVIVSWHRSGALTRPTWSILWVKHATEEEVWIFKGMQTIFHKHARLLDKYWNILNKQMVAW